MAIDCKAEAINKGTYYIIEIVYYCDGISWFYHNNKRIDRAETFREVVLTLRKTFCTRTDAEKLIESKAVKALIKTVNKGGLD